MGNCLKPLQIQESKDYKSRNTEYATEPTLGTVSEAVSREGSGNSATYKIKKDYKNGWDSTLSTGGYASGETVVKNLRYNINGNCLWIKNQLSFI